MRMTSRWLAIGFSTRDRRAVASRIGNSAASVAELTKLKVTTSCQSRATSRRLTPRAERVASGVRQHVLHVRGRRGRYGVVAVQAARLPR